MTWQAIAVFNAVIGVAYLVIFGLIVRGLWATRAAGRNVLGWATAAIFFTCGVHHGSHSMHLLGPSLGFDMASGLAMRSAFGWEMTAWDAVDRGSGDDDEDVPRQKCREARRQAAVQADGDVSTEPPQRREA